jgi:hypothetical protein
MPGGQFSNNLKRRLGLHDLAGLAELRFPSFVKLADAFHFNRPALSVTID